MGKQVYLDDDTLKTKGYVPGFNFDLIEKRPTIPVVHDEIAAVSQFAPVAFLRTEHEEREIFSLVLVTALAPEANVLVSNKRWLGDYLPSIMRSYPFNFEMDSSGKEMRLAVDEDSVKDTAAPNVAPFYNDEGELTDSMKRTVQFLKVLVNSRLETAKHCQELAQAGLIEPWDISYSEVVDGKRVNKKFSGLYHVNRNKLKELDADTLLAMNQSGSLAVAYGQLMSEIRVKFLAGLNDAHMRASKKANGAASTVMPDIDKLFGDDDDLLKF